MYFTHSILPIVMRSLAMASIIFMITLPGCHCNCDDGYYKLCDDQCVMRGSQFGKRFDLPCSDNVSFMMAHKVTGIEPDDYQADFTGADSTLQLFQDATASLALHDPLFPAVAITGVTEVSENITFTLDSQKIIQSANLYIRVTEADDPGLTAMGFQPIVNSPGLLKCTWAATAPGIFTQTIHGPSPIVNAGVDRISFTTSFAGLAINKFTLVTYKFQVAYTDATSEDMEITFALQDYHLSQHLPEIPAPVYVQGDVEQLVDILMVPARNDQGPPLTTAALGTFRQKSRSIIKEVVFSDPTMRFWRKQFNFWINKQEGEAIDYDRCPTCCHVGPSNDVASFELKALLHEADQRDFADNCDSYFSAEMDPDKTAFLHELGHAAFWLKDEYPGYNGHTTDHLPNNWDTKRSAEDDATLRHKTRSDARLITF